MVASHSSGQETSRWQLEASGPATLTQVIEDVERQAASGDVSRFERLSTGFEPLDDVLNGGLLPGDLMTIGGPFGVGKTIFGLQVARNVVRQDQRATALYICYEHDRAHLMSRLLCLESAESGAQQHALTLRRLGNLALEPHDGVGVISRLRRSPHYAPVLDVIDSYSDRLVLVKASGDLSTLDDIRRWVDEQEVIDPRRVLVVVDYLQKIPTPQSLLQPEAEVTTYLTQGLKEMAMSRGICVIAIAASDREGLKSRRMRLSDLRGSSAIQYESDIGLILNNKYNILSREHMVYNLSQADTMRNWVVMSVEKNRAGRNALDMEYELDASHFRMVASGRFVRERLVDQKVILE